MNRLLKILLVCALVIVAVHIAALVGVFAYSRIKGNDAKTVAGSHVVERGETLSAIAARAGSSVPELAKLNGLADANHITEGQILKLPRQR